MGDAFAGVCDGVAEVAAERVADIVEVLLPQRLFRHDTVDCGKLRLDLVRRQPALLLELRLQIAHGIAGHQPDHEERQRDNDENYDERHYCPPHNIAEHQSSPVPVRRSEESRREFRRKPTRPAPPGRHGTESSAGDVALRSPFHRVRRRGRFHARQTQVRS